MYLHPLQSSSVLHHATQVPKSSSQAVKACRTCRGCKVETEQYNFRQMEVHLPKLTMTAECLHCDQAPLTTCLPGCREPAMHAMVREFSIQIPHLSNYFIKSSKLYG